MSVVARWLRRMVLLMLVVGALRCGDERSLPTANWLRHRQDLRLVDRTFPAQWTTGSRWTVEYECDVRTLTDHEPLRSTEDYNVLGLEDGRALIQVVGGIGWNPETRFIWDMRRFRLEALPASEHNAPPTLAESGFGWKQLEEDTLPTCFQGFSPWYAPVVHRATSAGDVREVLGERWFGQIHQRAWIENDMVRFELHPAGREDSRLSIVWRPGDPWWAKLECYVPGRATSPPPLSRKQWVATGRPAWPGPTATRDARARLVAIDGVPIEPLPWEHPPVDWMDPSGR